MSGRIWLCSVVVGLSALCASCAGVTLVSLGSDKAPTSQQIGGRDAIAQAGAGGSEHVESDHGHGGNDAEAQHAEAGHAAR